MMRLVVRKLPIALAVALPGASACDEDTAPELAEGTCADWLACYEVCRAEMWDDEADEYIGDPGECIHPCREETMAYTATALAYPDMIVRADKRLAELAATSDDPVDLADAIVWGNDLRTKCAAG